MAEEDKTLAKVERCSQRGGSLTKPFKCYSTLFVQRIFETLLLLLADDAAARLSCPMSS
jgi:hypothetical protein